jgi:hypothetical protein
MMMGCGVYPANMDRDQRFRPLLSDLVKPADRNPHTPFDFYLRHAMSQAGIANTTLIADMWQTCEYKKTAKGITCKPVPLDKPRRERGGLVPHEAVLVHGCKDGTLAELLLGAAEYYVPKERVAPKLELPPLIETEHETGKSDFVEAVTALFTPDSPAPAAPIVVKEVPHPDDVPPTPAVLVEAGMLDPTYSPPPEPEKPKITRTAVEAMRKSKKGVAIDIAQGLGITLGEFAGMLPKLGYVIAKGGKLKSTEP